MTDELRSLRREIRRLEYELRASVETVPLLRAMVDGSRDGLALFDVDGGLVEHNRAFATMVRGDPADAEVPLPRGTRLDAMLAVPPSEPPLWPPADRPGEPRIARPPIAEAAGDLTSLEVLLTPADVNPERRVWVANARALTNETLQARALVEARRHVDDLTRELSAQQRFATLFEHSPDALLLAGPTGELLLKSALAAAWWPSLAAGDNVARALPELAAALESAAGVGGGASPEIAWWSETAVGTFHIRATVVPMAGAHGFGALVSARDTTAQQRAEEALETSLALTSASLAEREVLLREVHHRVKNNLQIISSLLGMQADDAEPAAGAALGESALRVRSMALVHELLYGGDDLSHVEFSRYIDTLVHELAGALCPEAKLTLDLEPIDLVIDQAIPAGLILNELLTNAFKHGRAPNGCCCIAISATRQSERHLRLAVSDGGPGLPQGLDSHRAGSLGMTIAQALSRQLGGELTLEPGPGARFALSFPVT